MTQILRSTAGILLCLYGLLLSTWWVIHLLVGDRVWWMALTSSFTPLFFLPLLLFWPFSLWIRQPIYWLGLLLPTTLFLYLYGVLFIPKTPPPYLSTPAPLRLMTFNHWSGSLSDETAQVILDNNLPDIVALQEVSPPVQRRILQTVGQHYPYFFFDTTIGHRGTGVLSRYPLEPVSSTPFIELSCLQYQVTVDPTHRFRLYNCHPHSTNVLYFVGNSSSIIKQIQESFRLRTRLSEQLAEEIQAHAEPTIVVGDFNTTDQSEAYGHLHKVLLDAQRTSGWGFGHTFPAYGGSYHRIPIIPRQVRIDMVLYTSDFVALQTSVSTSHGESDHLPVRAMLGWRDFSP